MINRSYNLPLPIPTTKSKPLVLIVDDVPKNLQVLGAFLYEANYEISMAENGLVALDLLKDIKPDLILLDVMMPGMNGFEVCSKIKSDDTTKDIPIIFLTAKSDSNSIIEGFKHGAVDYITKPFNSDELLLRVNNQIQLTYFQKGLIEFNEQLNRLLEQKTEFLSIAAHDMKSPLNSIIGFSELSISELCTNNIDVEVSKNKLLSNLEIIRSTSKNMLKTINELLSNELLESGKIQLNLSIFDVGKLVLSVLNTHLPAAYAKSISIFYRNGMDPCPLYLDESKFREIIDNIINNAIKFSPKYKSIWVNLSQRIESDDYFFTFSVRDEGPGLNDSDKDKVFGKFQKLSAIPTGDEISSGLGLSIVKRLTEIMGGSVKVASSEGNGAEFIVEFPISKDFAESYSFTNNSEFVQINSMGQIEDTLEKSAQTEIIEISLLNKVIDLLESDFSLEWNLLKKTMVVNDIYDFAVKLTSLGMNYSIDYIIEYGKLLSNEAITFDINKLSKTLGEFPDLIRKIRSIIN